MPLRWETIPFGEWVPDLPPLRNPGALEARNVISEAQSYRSLPSLVPLEAALPAPAVGYFWTFDESNAVFLFAGTATGLFRLISGTWTDISRVGGYTGVGNWEFIKFGDLVIAFSRGVSPQVFDLSNPTVNFADLTPGTPVDNPNATPTAIPQAARAAVVRDFIVAGDFGSEPDRLVWSGFNNAQLWSTGIPANNIAAQADFQELFGRGGRIQRIVPGDYGVIFQEHAIWRMDYVGPKAIWNIQEIEPNRGTPAPNSVAWTGRQIYYLAHDGFYTTDGTGPSVPIGVNRVDKFFRDNSARNNTSLLGIRSAIDRRNRLVIWAYRSTAGMAQNDRLIIYNWGTDRWSRGVLDTQLLGETLSVGVTLEGMDAILPSGIDTNPVNFDDPDFQGGALGFIAFDTANRRSAFAGTALDALIDTKEFSITDGVRIFANAVRPLVDGSAATITLQAGTRDTQDGASPTFAPATGLNDIGEADMLIDTRYLRYRVAITGGFDHAMGVEVHARESGRR